MAIAPEGGRGPADAGHADRVVDAQAERLLRALLREVPLKTAVSIALEAQGGSSRKDLYRRALELQRVHQASLDT